MHRTRSIRALAGLAAAAVTLACAGAPGPRPPARRLVVLGFDGLDPALVERWMNAGRLPHFKRLADQGGFYRLETTHSPESPTAWASFATGVTAGKHNIFDFLVRDLRTYLPDLSMVERQPGRFLFDLVPIARPTVRSTRGGTSFWVLAGRAGIRASVLTVPVTFPPEEVPNGELLSGLPLPDIRGTMGTFQYFATDLSRYEEGDTEMGGILRRLVFDGDVARTELVGPPNPIVRQQLRRMRARGVSSDADRQRVAELEARADLTLPLTIRWNRDPRAPSATIEVAGETVLLRPGEWSRWLHLEFSANWLVRLYGMAQMYLVSAGDELRLYVSPINWDPERPPLPMSSPSRVARDLYRRLGPYRTLGWAEATWPLNEGRIDEKAFMEDLYRAFDDRANVILDRADRPDWQLLVAVIESTDRVQHMMWRLVDPSHPMYDAALAADFGPAIERVYRRADQFVGELLDHLDPGTPVLIVSDHGFHSWRKAVNLNTWLVQQGYMTLREPASRDKTLWDLFGGGGEFWEHVDWTRTRAYAMGIGQIYVNLRGREARGTVEPGAEYRTLVEEIGAKLLALTEPETGARVVRAVYKRDDIYTGEYVPNAPDLQLGFEDGYRVSWQTTLGGAPPGLVYPNLTKWSGDHGGFDYQTTAGVLISNRKVEHLPARLIDIAPTVLRYFDVAVPSSIDGRALF